MLCAVTVIAEQPAALLRESDRRDWQRHPVDVARLVTRLALLALILILTAAFPNALTRASADLVRLFNQMPAAVRYGLVSIAQLSILIVPIVLVTWLLVRRTRAATALVVGAGVLGAAVMALLTDWLNRAAPPTSITDLPSSSFIPTDFPSASYLAALVAGATAASPLIVGRWRGVVWTAVGVCAIVRVLSSTQAPVSIAVTYALGASIGSAVLVAFGSPQRRPGSATLRAALATGAFDVDDLADEAAARGVRTYHGTSGGRSVDVTYLDRDDRDAELFSRVVRSIRVRDVDEQTISARPRQRAAYVAMVTSLAQRTGARVPDVLAVVPSEGDSAVYVTETPAGRPLGELGGGDVRDAALDDAWAQLGLLHRARIAHRSLSAGNIVVDGDEVTFTGLDTMLLASTVDARSIDRVELLVATAVVVGVDRALDAATRNVDRDQLAAALAYVQIPALPAHASKLLGKQRKQLIDELRTGLQERLGVEAVELAELERISIAKVISWVGFAVLGYFLLSIFGNWADITEAMRGADWRWMIPVLVATLLGTVGGAMSLSGCVVRPIALGEATVVMFGQSFLNRFTPMNAGGMAMRIRYLQKGGTDGTVAAAAIGLTSAASGVVQVVYLALFLLWSSSDATEGLTGGDDSGGADLTLVFVFVGAIVVAALVIALTPKFRRWLVGFVRSTLAKIKRDFGELARRPSKLGLLFGGAALGKMCTIVAFVSACRAFDIDLSFATLGALYMLANTVASTVPTPGGVGAIEAALVFVLTNAGVDDATAWAAVLLFRLINYWFPTIPGYVALRISERRALI